MQPDLSKSKPSGKTIVRLSDLEDVLRRVLTLPEIERPLPSVLRRLARAVGTTLEALDVPA